MEVKNNHDGLILIAAFRYALGRMTYIVGSVVDEIIANWKNLPEGDRWLITSEIREAIENHRAGMDMDVKQWERILEL